MATREELESQEANCSDGAAYAELAMQALQDPKDADYAKELMEQGEMSSSFPIHYVKLAEVAIALGDTDKANALYEEAEGMCFEAKEKVDVGFSIAMHLGDKEKGRALIEEALADTTDTTELMSLAGKIQEGLGDETLANSIFDKITGKCKSIADFKDLAVKIKASGDDSSAKMVYEKAQSLTDGTDDVVEFAGGFVELFDDKEKAATLLSGIEGDCMFPGQFVALAGGFKKLLDNSDKAAELLEQGKAFAMSGEENLDLATGYATLLGDQDTAAEMYQAALNDFSSKDDLLKLAGAVAKHMDDKSLAGKAYAKVEGNMSTIADLSKLAQAVNDDLGDKEQVAGIYERAEAKLDKPAELVALATEVAKNLEDTDKVSSIYRKALDNSNSFIDTGKLLDAYGKTSVAPELIKDTLAKALDLSEDAAQMVDIAKRSHALMGDDKSVALKALDKAEENVSTLDEMRKLTSAVKELAADDIGRNERMVAKLEKREASQARYVEFQNREKTLSRPTQFIALAGEVVEELDDTSYASQLLSSAEEKLKGNTFSLSNYIPLIIAVSNLVKDNAWTTRLLDLAKDNSGFFAQVRELGSVATTQLGDLDAGKQWATSLYKSWKDKLDSADANTFEYIKLANAVSDDLGDAETVNRLVEAGAAKANNPFHFAYLGDLAKKMADDSGAEALYKKAAGACGKSSELAQLVQHLRKSGASEDLQKSIYAQGESLLANAQEKLSWAEGIQGLFADKDWAGKAYDAIKGSFTSANEQVVFANSKHRHLGERHFW